ncbi:hypothetical protein HKX48_005248 [Thoreauomyces humboldtii]|nr:hypothetical protein HKX48_005248 [Thoreauomyces humboldtii]
MASTSAASNATREASHAGSWYSSSAEKLSSELDGWLAAVPETPPVQTPNCRAIIAPHAGYSYSGPSAAYAYACVDVSKVDRVFILGPSHHVYLDGCALSKCSVYATPLGNLNVDAKVNKELFASGLFTWMSQTTDEEEHSIEMHLPYIHKIMQSKTTAYTITPILVGALSSSSESTYGSLLAPYLHDPSTLFVVSSDFCHWGSRFSYTSLPTDGVSPSATISERIEQLDREGMRCIETGDPEKFQAYLKKTRNTICGRHPIGVLMWACAGKGEIRFVRYAQSGKVATERESSVSYASAYWCLLA